MKTRKPWKACSKKVWRSITCAAYPVWDQFWPPWSSPRSTASSASPRLRSFVATPACASTDSSGGSKTFQGKLLRHCNKWLLLGLRRGRLGCHWLLGLLRGLLQTQASPWQRSPAFHLATARLMARFTWQLLTQRRAYTSVPNTPKPACRADCLCSGRLGQGSGRNRSKIRPISLEEDFPQSLQNNAVGREAEGFDDAPFNKDGGLGT